MDSAHWQGELGGFEQHPLSAVFPAMAAAEFAKLRADIAKHGLRHAITLYNGRVLDGWHRCRCCSETGVEITTVNFEGDEREALAFVMSANLARRHLTTSDRAMIAAKLATLKQGERQTAQMVSLRIGEAAEHLKISPNSVKRARKLLARGTPELIARVQSNDLSISAASLLLPPPARPRVVVEGGYTIEAWRALPEDERAALLGLRNRKARLNRQSAGEDSNAIDWARWSYSPITGCKHDCPYCYISDFVSEVPLFHPDRLAAPLNQAPPVTNDIRDRSIFAGRWPTCSVAGSHRNGFKQSSTSSARVPSGYSSSVRSFRSGCWSSSSHRTYGSVPRLTSRTGSHRPKTPSRSCERAIPSACSGVQLSRCFRGSCSLDSSIWSIGWCWEARQPHSTARRGIRLWRWLMRSGVSAAPPDAACTRRATCC